MELLRLSGHTVVRGGTRLLNRVDWTVRAGERWVVLGANAAGKTTLLHTAAAAASCDVVGLVDHHGVPSGMTALDAVLSGAHGHLGSTTAGTDARDLRRAQNLLVRLGCAPVVDRGVESLSDGERRRVMLARALMPDPELLLLDEPAAGLDLAGREALVHWLGRLAADPAGPALVLVTHQLEEVPPATTHALLLRGGSVTASGPLRDVLTDQNLTACFGLPVRVERRDGRFSARLALAG